MGSLTIELDTQYKYLGIILSANGALKPAVTTLANQTSKALFTLMRGAAKLSFPKSSLLCYLFDSLVRPVADYGCEVWGHTRAEELEIIHRRFCKFSLGVPRTTSNLVCYSELGRYPLDISIDIEPTGMGFETSAEFTPSFEDIRVVPRLISAACNYISPLALTQNVS